MMPHVCSQYVDTNTSSLILTYMLGTTILLTRYSECIQTSDTNEYAEGAWRVAKGQFLPGENFTMKTDFGFHESGKVSMNTISWSNGAVWNAFLPSEQYSTPQYGIVTLKEKGNKWDVYNSSKQIVGSLYANCDDVMFSYSKGKIVGDFIIWNNIDAWEPYGYKGSKYESYDYGENSRLYYDRSYFDDRIVEPSPAPEYSLSLF